MPSRFRVAGLAGILFELFGVGALGSGEDSLLGWCNVLLDVEE